MAQRSICFFVTALLVGLAPGFLAYGQPDSLEWIEKSARTDSVDERKVIERLRALHASNPSAFDYARQEQRLLQILDRTAAYSNELYWLQSSMAFRGHVKVSHPSEASAFEKEEKYAVLDWELEPNGKQLEALKKLRVLFSTSEFFFRPEWVLEQLRYSGYFTYFDIGGRIARSLVEEMPVDAFIKAKANPKMPAELAMQLLGRLLGAISEQSEIAKEKLFGSNASASPVNAPKYSLIRIPVSLAHEALRISSLSIKRDAIEWSVLDAIGNPEWVVFVLFALLDDAGIDLQRDSNSKRPRQVTQFISAALARYPTLSKYSYSLKKAMRTIHWTTRDFSMEDPYPHLRYYRSNSSSVRTEFDGSAFHQMLNTDRQWIESDESPAFAVPVERCASSLATRKSKGWMNLFSGLF